MKFSIFSTSLLLATRARAIPASIIIIDLALDSGLVGDLKVPFDVLYDVSGKIHSPHSHPLCIPLPPKNNLTADSISEAQPQPCVGFTVNSGGNNLIIPSGSIVCQAFADAVGRRRLGGTFRQAVPFTNVISEKEFAIGSVFCSDAAAVQAYLNDRPADGVPVVRAVPVPFVRVRLNFAQGSIDEETPPDNSIHVLWLATVAQFATISLARGVDANQVLCQVYEDKNATKKLGRPFSGTQKSYLARDGGETPIGSFRCKRIDFPPPRGSVNEFRRT